MGRRRIMAHRKCLTAPEPQSINPSKKVFGYIGEKLKGEWDSLTKCGNALGLSIALVKKHIETGVPVESGFILKLS